MPTKPLPYETPWSAPYRRTVLEDQVQKGLQRVSNAGNDVSPGLWGGLGKTAATDQDVLGGLLQALAAPVSSVGSMAAPLMNAMKGQYFPTPGDLLGQKPKTFGDVFGAPGQVGNNLGDAFSKLSGYPQERSRELGNGMVAAAAPGAVSAGGKLEGLLNKMGMTSAPKPGAYNSFISIRQKSNLPQFIKDKVPDAEALEAADVQPKEIFKDLGWLRHPIDGDWRYEISDKGARIKLSNADLANLRDEEIRTGQLHSVKAKDFLEHPTLYSMVPELGEIGVTTQHTPNSSFRYNRIYPQWLDPQKPAEMAPMHANRGHGLATIGLRDVNNVTQFAPATQILDHTLHEIPGHAMQNRNPRASFGSNELIAGGFDKYIRNGGEIEANLLGARMGLDQNQLHNIYPYSWYMHEILGDMNHKARSPFINSEMTSHGRRASEQTEAWDDYYKKIGIIK